MRTASRDVTFLAGVLAECRGVTRGKLRCLFLHKSNKTRVVSHVNDPLVTLEKFWLHITMLVVVKRDEAFNPRLPVVYLGFEYRSDQELERRGFAANTTAKYADECLDLVHLQTAKPVVTLLTEQKSAKVHDETPVCDQAQHTLHRAAVGKLQHKTGVRDRIFCSCKVSVIQTRIAHTCRLDACEEGAEIFERNTTFESLFDDSCNTTQRLE